MQVGLADGRAGLRCLQYEALQISLLVVTPHWRAVAMQDLKQRGRQGLAETRGCKERVKQLRMEADLVADLPKSSSRRQQIVSIGG